MKVDDTKINDLLETFSLLPDWEERYTHVIELGKKMPPLPQEYKNENFKVKGCMSQVWLVPQKKGDRYFFLGDSDAAIVKGLVAIVIMAYENKTPQEIAHVDIENLFEKMGLSEHLSPIRRNGFFAMVKKIQTYAGLSPAPKNL